MPIALDIHRGIVDAAYLEEINNKIKENPEETLDLSGDVLLKVYGETIAHLAARWGHLDVLREILNVVPVAQRQVLLTQTDAYGRTVAHCAAARGHLDVLREILNAVPVAQRQALLTQGDNNGYTIVHLAAYKGHWDVLREILKVVPVAQRQAILTQGDNNGKTVAHIAAYKGHWDVLREILKVVPVAQRQAILIQGNNDGFTVAHYAAGRGHLDVLRDIFNVVTAVQRQAILTQGDNNGRTVAHLAAGNGHLDVLQEILKSCETDAQRQGLLTQCDNNGITIAHIAALEGHWDVLREILKVVPVDQRQAILTQVSNNGNTVAHCAAARGHWDVLREILNVVPAAERQALLIQGDNRGKTVAHIAAAGGHLDVLREILKVVPVAQRQTLLTQADNNGNTIAHTPAARGHLDVLREILNAVPDAERQALLTQGDNDGNTIAHLAARMGHLDVLREILNVVQDAQREALLTQADNNGYTIAYYAAYKGHLDVLREILKTCTTVDQSQALLTQGNTSGNTIAHTAAAGGHLNVLREIFNVVTAVQRQAFLTQASNNGYTIAHIAAAEGNFDVLQWILQQCSFADDSPSHGLSAAAEQTCVGANVSLRAVLSAVSHVGRYAGKPTVQIIAERLPQEACLEMLSMSPSAHVKEAFIGYITECKVGFLAGMSGSDFNEVITTHPCLCDLASSQDGTIVLPAELNEAIVSLVTVEGQRLSADLQAEQAFGTFLHCSEQWQGTFDRLPDWVKESQAAQEVLAEFNFKMAEVYEGPLAFMKDSSENLISHLESIPSKSIHFSDAQFKLYNVYMQIAQQGIDEDEEDIIEQYCDKAAKALLDSGAAQRIFATSASMDAHVEGGFSAFVMITNKALIFKVQSLCDEVINIAQADDVSVYRQELESVYEELTMILEQIHHTGLESMQVEVREILDGEMNVIVVSIMNSYQSAQLNESENIIQPLLESIESLCPGLLEENGVSLEPQDVLSREKDTGKSRP